VILNKDNLHGFSLRGNLLVELIGYIFQRSQSSMKDFAPVCNWKMQKHRYIECIETYVQNIKRSDSLPQLHTLFDLCPTTPMC